MHCYVIDESIYYYPNSMVLLSFKKTKIEKIQLRRTMAYLLNHVLDKSSEGMVSEDELMSEVWEKIICEHHHIVCGRL